MVGKCWTLRCSSTLLVGFPDVPYGKANVASPRESSDKFWWMSLWVICLWRLGIPTDNFWRSYGHGEEVYTVKFLGNTSTNCKLDYAFTMVTRPFIVRDLANNWQNRPRGNFFYFTFYQRDAKLTGFFSHCKSD